MKTVAAAEVAAAAAATWDRKLTETASRGLIIITGTEFLLNLLRRIYFFKDFFFSLLNEISITLLYLIII
jgi:hypothetical protein